MNPNRGYFLNCIHDLKLMEIKMLEGINKKKTSPQRPNTQAQNWNFISFHVCRFGCGWVCRLLFVGKVCQMNMGVREEASWPLEASAQLFSPLETPRPEFYSEFQPWGEVRERELRRRVLVAAKGRNQEEGRVARLGRAAPPALASHPSPSKVRVLVLALESQIFQLEFQFRLRIS